MRVVPLTCPKCDASLDMENDNSVRFCKYCGVPIYFDDGTRVKVKVNHFIDEAKLQKVFSKERLKKAEMKTETYALKFLFLMLLLSFGLTMYFSSQEKAEKTARISQGYVEAPYSASSAKDEDYQNIETAFKKAGFKNVRSEGKGDLWIGVLNKEGAVIEVSIDGQTSFWSGDTFPPDAEVRVVYHSF